MRFAAEKVSQTKVVRLRMGRQATHLGPDDRPVWTIIRPGSYAPGSEHLANETYPVRHTGFTFTRTLPGNGRWELQSVALVLDGPVADILTDIEAGQDTSLPLWITQLAVQAAQMEE